ncbi:l1 transposable element-related [Holotrichia oblita]|uniref:L1 transposable element-related n=1 Tax=Holotrichia oblita TaxID=644536 RepID=A0ACB9SV04_HOLOL|nr:l1 transposable element-related [Holotrichia oblita]
MVLSRSQIAEYEDLIIQAFKKESFIASISSSISEVINTQMSKIVQVYETKISSLENEIKDLKSSNEKLKVECNEKTDRLEQYSRQNSVRIFGVKEVPTENIEEVVKEIIMRKLNINLADSYIEKCHRVGLKKTNSDRPVIVKFSSYKHKSEVFRHKSKLKGTNIIMREDLTYYRLMEFRRLTEKYGRRNVWTMDGVIYYNTEGTVKKLFGVK